MHCFWNDVKWWSLNQIRIAAIDSNSIIAKHMEFPKLVRIVHRIIIMVYRLFTSNIERNHFFFYPFSQITYDLLLLIVYSISVWHITYTVLSYFNNKNLFFFNESLESCKKNIVDVMARWMRMYASF